MIRALVLLSVAGALGAAGAGVLASDTTHPTADEAAQAAFVELLPGWNIAGECDEAVTPAPADVCWGFGPGRSTEDYSIYGAHAFQVTDTGWWIGIVEVDGGWKWYGGGRCDIFYCRLATPDDEVLFGFPGGDANCDGSANSQDALLILQVVAELVERQGLRCIAEADVFPGSLSSLDALSILQSEAGLIGALPVKDFQITH